MCVARAAEFAIFCLAYQLTIGDIVSCAQNPGLNWACAGAALTVLPGVGKAVGVGVKAARAADDARKVADVASELADAASNANDAMVGIRTGYKQIINSMHSTEDAMRAGGASDEEIARTLSGMRNDAKVLVRTLMTPDDVAKLEVRNMELYGDPVGPTPDEMYSKYKSWQGVIEASYRSNAAIDKALGLGDN